MVKRSALRIGISLAAVFALWGSAGCRATPQPTPAGLRILADPPDARVYIDDRFVASAQLLSRRAHTLPPGAHRVTVSAPGYFPHDLQTDLPAGLSTLKIKLRPIPP